MGHENKIIPQAIHGPLSLSQSLDLELISLSGAIDSGDQFFLATQDFLLFYLNHAATLNDLRSEITITVTLNNLSLELQRKIEALAHAYIDLNFFGTNELANFGSLDHSNINGKQRYSHMDIES
jgi:hypothetical protein